MIKRIIESFYKIVLVIAFLLAGVLPPVEVLAKEYETLGEYKAELKKMQNKLKENQNKQNKTQAEINAAQNNMGETYQEIENAEKNIVILTEEINVTNEEIVKLKENNEELLLMYQELENENVYFSYITGASTITEMIMRMDVISQLADYNQEQLEKMEQLIKNNEKKSKELVKQQDKLNKKIVEYEDIINYLEDDLSKLIDGVPTLEDNINDLKKTIKAYEDAGCKDNEPLSVCMNAVNNSGWLRPLTKSKVTSAFGMRLHPTKKVWTMHNGIDLSASEGTKVYAPANGIIGATVTIDEWSKYKSSLKCGGQKVYLNVYVDGVKYTVVYMHLLEVYVEVGEAVTTDTVIGLSGGGVKTQKYDECTTGGHLHYGISKGVHYDGSSSSATKLKAGYINPPGFPSKGSWFYTR